MTKSTNNQANSFPCKVCGEVWSEESGAYPNFTCEKCNASYPITSVCKADLTHPEVGLKPSQISKLDEADMERIASKMADAYLENGYWIDLEIFANSVLDDK